jgi:hypothetical protein
MSTKIRLVRSIYRSLAGAVALFVTFSGSAPAEEFVMSVVRPTAPSLLTLSQLSYRTRICADKCGGTFQQCYKSCRSDNCKMTCQRNYDACNDDCRGG